MDYLPIFLDVKDRPCLVVGGGKVAARKLALLHRAGARITVVAPDVCNDMRQHLQQENITCEQREFRDSDLDDTVLVIAATSDEAVNRHVSLLAGQRHIPANVADNPKLCNFIMPSVIDRSPVQIAVSTGGSSPVLARLLRARLESFIPAAYGRLARMVDDYRQEVKQRFAEPAKRRYFWESILQGRVAELLFAGQEEKARTALETAINSTDEEFRSG
ncbi:MAG: bifunctional precorrin-2 dehydrogenase/sirohydrochlorin ferrochelatase, partial [Gammaproteobacteria bacterium]|nr:bifunctional precorrin-2 dehydrogenase/sirohydrochlorin ferrochelatase [Gammaproteobacteria bacterium]